MSSGILQIAHWMNDNHGSKIVVVPLDGEAFDRDMQQVVAAERR